MMPTQSIVIIISGLIFLVFSAGVFTFPIILNNKFAKLTGDDEQELATNFTIYWMLFLPVVVLGAFIAVIGFVESPSQDLRSPVLQRFSIAKYFYMVFGGIILYGIIASVVYYFVILDPHYKKYAKANPPASGDDDKNPTDTLVLMSFISQIVTLVMFCVLAYTFTLVVDEKVRESIFNNNQMTNYLPVSGIAGRAPQN